MRLQRRLGAEGSETRAKLIDAAAHVISAEGVGAVTARRLAEMVGLRRHIIHYYFGTIEELLLAVLRRDTEHTRIWLSTALKAEDPFRIVWELASRAAPRVLEFSSLATRHPAIRDEYRQASEEFRATLVHVLERYVAEHRLVTNVPCKAIIITLQSIAYTLSIERSLEIDAGHDVMKASLHALLGVKIDT